MESIMYYEYKHTNLTHIVMTDHYTFRLPCCAGLRISRIHITVTTNQKFPITYCVDK